MITKSLIKTRNADATKKRILKAAKKEFANNGLAGARVDIISERAGSNKRMLYHYFGNKETLFQTILELAYLDIRTAEQNLKLDHLSPTDALKSLVEFTWNYYIKNPEFLSLINTENLHKGVHLKKSPAIQHMSRKYIEMVENILNRGISAGEFRKGIDPIQLNITIAAIGYYYLTNRYTGQIIFEKNLLDKDALKERLSFNIDTILSIVKA